MNIETIFAVVPDVLYAVKFDDKPADEFKYLFDSWRDPEYLEQFFEYHKEDLQSGFFKQASVEQAIITTIDESAKFERNILMATKQSAPNATHRLENFVFEPLHNRGVFSNEYMDSKARGIHKRSWLRIYAIRLEENVYFVTGGGIKLTKDMRPPHLQVELEKLKKAKEYLKTNFIADSDDLGFIELGSYEEE